MLFKDVHPHTHLVAASLTFDDVCVCVCVSVYLSDSANTALRTLMLLRNCVGDAGAVALAEALRVRQPVPPAPS